MEFRLWGSSSYLPLRARLGVDDPEPEPLPEPLPDPDPLLDAVTRPQFRPHTLEPIGAPVVAFSAPGMLTKSKPKDELEK